MTCDLPKSGALRLRQPEGHYIPVRLQFRVVPTLLAVFNSPVRSALYFLAFSGGLALLASSAFAQPVPGQKPASQFEAPAVEVDTATRPDEGAQVEAERTDAAPNDSNVLSEVVPLPKPTGADVPAVVKADEKLVAWLNGVHFVKEACEIMKVDLETVEPLTGKGACGVASPVILHSVGEGDKTVTLSGDPHIGCEFASVLSRFVREDVQPLAEQELGQEVSQIRTGPGYTCRLRNNQSSGKISEHARGKAIDMLGFELADGEFVSVAKDWGGDTPKGRFLSKVHDAACKHFTTVLGPEADSYHTTHFHLDTGCHGKSCTYLICQ